MQNIKKAYKTIKIGKKFKSPKIIILMGLPGSGKSYAADYLYNQYGFTVLSGENISNALFENDQNTDYLLVYKILRQLASELLSQGYSIVIDGTNLKYIFRKQIYDEVCKKIKTILIYLTVDDKTALERIGSRRENRNDKQNIISFCSKETFEKFKTQMEIPLNDEPHSQIKSDSKLLLHIDSIIK